MYAWPTAAPHYKSTFTMGTETSNILRVCWYQTSHEKENTLLVAFQVRVSCKLHHVKKKGEKQLHQLDYASLAIYYNVGVTFSHSTPKPQAWTVMYRFRPA